MTRISYKRHRVPVAVIQHAVWLYFRFALSLRDVDEMVSTIAGEHVWIWRAVDDEGEVLDMIVRKRRDTGAALRLLQRLLKNQNVEPEVVVTDGLRSYGAALERLGMMIVIDPDDCARSIASRTHISPFEDGSARCRGSRADHPRSDSLRRMRQSTTRSTSSGIC